MTAAFLLGLHSVMGKADALFALRGFVASSPERTARSGAAPKR